MKVSARILTLNLIPDLADQKLISFLNPLGDSLELLNSVSFYADGILGENTMDRDQLIEEIKKQILEELKGAASPLTDKISDEHKAEMMEMKNSMEASVKENPWMAVGLAALAGFVIARFLYRRDD